MDRKVPGWLRAFVIISLGFVFAVLLLSGMKLQEAVFVVAGGAFWVGVLLYKVYYRRR